VSAPGPQSKPPQQQGKPQQPKPQQPKPQQQGKPQPPGKGGQAPARKQVPAGRVRAELLPEQSEALLRELHLLTRQGSLNADALRKLKQVNHLVGLLKPALDDLQARYADPLVVDAGSGNAYLGFVLYELFFKGREGGTVLNVEGRADLSERAKERAARLGFGRMQFQTAHLAEAQVPERLHLVLGLHACDTATDEALALAIRHRADHVAVVPCCQAEVARLLKEQKPDADSPYAALVQHPMHRREFSSHLTNVIRALVLEAHGYQVTVTELTGWEHSLKNELILGRKVHRESRPARQKLEALLQSTGVKPALVRLLEQTPAPVAADPAETP
jgi:SAM-dependent methyltransferase